MPVVERISQLFRRHIKTEHGHNTPPFIMDREDISNQVHVCKELMIDVCSCHIFSRKWREEREKPFPLPFYFTYSEKSVSFMSPLRASVSCMAKAAVRQ